MIIQALDTLTAHGLDPYQPYGGFDDIFDYADSQSTDLAGIRRPRTPQFLKSPFTTWQSSHPKK